MKPNMSRCGSAHCRKKHRWVNEGTPYARLYPENCGAGRNKTEEELEASYQAGMAFTKRILEKVEKEKS